jgi:signal transduction histidine kinase
MRDELSMSEALQRFSIASEIKDNIGQLILLARINLDLLSDEKKPDGHMSEFYAVRSLLDQALSDIRTLYSRLSPPLLSENGLESTLEYLCLQMENEYGLLVKFVDDGSEKPFGNMSHSIVMYYVAREILFNVARHVKDRAVQLSIGRTGNSLKLVVEDSGTGYDFHRIISDHRKMGRLDIRQCIQRMGGGISFTSIPGGRATITILAPLATTQSGIANDDELLNNHD